MICLERLVDVAGKDGHIGRRIVIRLGIEGAVGGIAQHVFGAVVAGYDDESGIMAVVEHIVAGILGRSAILVGLLFSLIDEVEGSAGCHTSLCKESLCLLLGLLWRHRVSDGTNHAQHEEQY